MQSTSPSSQPAINEGHPYVNVVPTVVNRCVLIVIALALLVLVEEQKATFEQISPSLGVIIGYFTGHVHGRSEGKLLRENNDGTDGTTA